MRDAELRSPEVTQRRARIRAATRAGRGRREVPRAIPGPIADALRRLLQECLNIRESAELVGVTYHEARCLIRAAEAAERVGCDV